MLYPSVGELVTECMHVWARLTTRRHSEMKKRVGSGERASILVVLSLDCIDEMLSCTARCILQNGADARINDCNIEKKRLIPASGMAVEECPATVVMPINKGFNRPFSSPVLSRKNHISSTTN